MLLKEAKIFAVDNSGADILRILQLFTCQLFHGKEFWLTVLDRFDIRRKLQAKRKYKVLPTNTAARRERKRGDKVCFDVNCIIMIADNFKRLIGSRMYCLVMREMRAIISLERAIIQRVTSYAFYTL